MSENCKAVPLFEKPPEAGIALDVFARLIELLAARRIIDRADVLELIEIAKKHGCE